MARLLPFLVLGFFLVQSAQGQPTLTHTTPGAVRPGQTVELHLHGTKLSHPLRVWTSFPSKVEVLSTAADKKNVARLRCKVTVPADVGVGIGGIFVGNSANSSDVIFLPLDDIPSVADNGKNHQLAQAQELKLPAAVDGVGDGSVFDYYKFTGKAGQRLCVEVLAARLGSSFDPVVRLFDPGGAELMLADDAAGVGPDCRFSLKIPTDGQYILQVSDNKYAAGGRYRMRIGDFPNITSPYPLGGRIGSTRRFEFAGFDAKQAPAVLTRVSTRSPFQNRVPLAARYKDGNASAMTTLVASSVPEYVEKEGNDDLKSANEVTLPCAVSGRFGKPGDADHYRFTARKGQRVTFAGISRSSGSPAYVFMRLVAADGKQIAETKVSAARELTLSQVIPADGTYILKTEDLLKRGGEEFAYRVAISEGPSFSLALKNDKTTTNRFRIPMNGAVVLNLTCARNGYDGPIKLTAELHGWGPKPAIPLKLRKDTISAKAKAHQVMFLVPPEAAGEIYAVRIVGRGADGSSHLQDIVRTDAWLAGRKPLMGPALDWHDGLLQFSAGGKVTPFYVNAISPSQVYYPTSLNQAQLTLTVTPKSKDFKSALQVELQGLPPGISYKVKQTKTSYAVTLTGPAARLKKDQTVQVVTYGQMKGSWLRSEHEITLRVVEPLAVSVRPAGPVSINGKQSVTVSVHRGAGSVAQPVTLKWTKLPAQVTGAASYTIPADQDQIEIELLAGGKAKVATAAATLSATTKYRGQDVTVTGSAQLEVRK